MSSMKTITPSVLTTPILLKPDDFEKSNFNDTGDNGIIWKPLLAGYAAGCCGLIAGHPLDSLKVLLQNSTSGSSTAISSPGPQTLLRQHQPSSVRLPRPAVGATAKTMQRTATYAVAKKQHLATAAISSMPVNTSSSISMAVNQRSIWSLYSGISAPLVTVGLVQSLNFCLYDSFRRVLHQRDGNATTSENSYRDHDSLSNVFASSFAAGSIVSVVTSPLAVLKVKQQLMMWSLRKAIKDTAKQSGGIIRNFYTGYQTHLFCDSVGRSVFFVSYEFLKRSFQERKIRQSTHQQQQSITLPERMASACVAGMFSWSVIFPFDVIRSKTYAHTALFPNKIVPSPFTMAKNMMYGGSNGRITLKPFFRGFGVTVARAGPVAAVCLPVYDLTLEWLN